MSAPLLRIAAVRASTRAVFFAALALLPGAGLFFLLPAWLQLRCARRLPPDDWNPALSRRNLADFLFTLAILVQAISVFVFIFAANWP